MIRSFINQENEEITRTNSRIDLYKIWRKRMATEFLSIDLLLRLNW